MNFVLISVPTVSPNRTNGNYIQYSHPQQSSINALNYINPTQTISNSAQPPIIQFNQLSPQLQLNSNYNYNNANMTGGFIPVNNTTNGCIQLPYNLNGTNNRISNTGNTNSANCVNFNRQQLILTIPNLASDILQNQNNNPNLTTTLTPSSIASPQTPLTPELSSNYNYNYNFASETKTDVVVGKTDTFVQKAQPLTKSQYKINENGKFQCLIINETNKICNKTFAHRSSLKRHKDLVHDKLKPFKCPFKGCSLAFGRLHLLKLHSRVHTGEKPYKCTDKNCNKAFKQRAHLTEHLRVHTGEKPYGCSFCGRKFRQKSVMDTHKRRHTGERPFKCKLCNHDFSHYTSYWRHKKNKICLKKKGN